MTDIVNTNVALNDTIVKSKEFFFNYEKEAISYPSNQVDAVVGFFESRGFEKTAAISTATILLRQAKIDNVKVMELLDQLKSFDDVKLNNLIGAILNTNRSAISKLGFVTEPTEENVITRNIVV
jgi:hypothetical protein